MRKQVVMSDQPIGKPAKQVFLNNTKNLDAFPSNVKKSRERQDKPALKEEKDTPKSTMLLRNLLKRKKRETLKDREEGVGNSSTGQLRQSIPAPLINRGQSCKLEKRIQTPTARKSGHLTFLAPITEKTKRHHLVGNVTAGKKKRGRGGFGGKEISVWCNSAVLLGVSFHSPST